jgi:hypothetical protein
VTVTGLDLAGTKVAVPRNAQRMNGERADELAVPATGMAGGAESTMPVKREPSG